MSLDLETRRLKQNPALALFEDEALRLLAFSAETRLLRGGDVLFREGDPSDGGYYIVSGRVQLAAADGAEEIHEVGALIGVAALFAETTRPATATALGPTTVRRISRLLMRRVLEEHPATAQRLRAHFGDNVRRVAGALDRIERLLAD